MYTPQKILSTNTKTGFSLNLPIKGHCNPTKNCAHDCYARTGYTAMPTSKKKQAWVSRYLANGSLDKLILECKALSTVRLNGTGDLNMNHVPAVISLAKACPRTLFWGMTRKIDVAKAINKKLPNLSLLVTVDASSPKETWKYKGAMCYGPRRPGDIIPDDKRIKTVFPRHFSGSVVAGVKKHPKDCQAVWHNISGCIECGQCWDWSK